MADFQTQFGQEELSKRIQDLEDLIRNHAHQGHDFSRKLFKTPLSRGQLINEAVLGDGINNPGKLLLQVAEGKGDTEVRAGIATGDFTNAGAATGFIFGIDDSDSDKVKFYWGGPSNNIVYDGSTLTVTGSLSVSSLNIPDTTTANSMHVETDGDTYWGANVASGFSAAPARVGKDGAAVFTSIQIGGATLQYQITNNGVFSFGDGSDGAVTISGNTTLTADKYYTTLTVDSSVTLSPAGYRIFATTSLTVNGTISRPGNTGATAGDGAGSAGGAGGAALADGYLKGSPVGANGGNGGNSNGDNGTSTSNSIGSNGVGGGKGGNGSVNNGGSGGSGGSASASTVKLIANWHLATLLDVGSTGSTVKFNNSASPGGGGAGGNGVQTGRGGGGAGSGGGIVAIYSKTITVAASGAITATGGNGGKGGDGSTANTTGGGGGGGGGNGGQLILVYNSYTNSGTVTANGGTGGLPSADAFGGPVAGTDGTGGSIRQFEISL